jgi:hypothetical protein
MEWYPFPDEFEAEVGASRASMDHLDNAGLGPNVVSGRARLTAIDLALIELIYGVIAQESRCSKCGAHLGRSIRVIPWTSISRAHWGASVTTRCRGWRRHRHVAAVARWKDLHLGPLQLR